MSGGLKINFVPDTSKNRSVPVPTPRGLTCISWRSLPECYDTPSPGRGTGVSESLSLRQNS